jgi:hypothetical protein
MWMTNGQPREMEMSEKQLSENGKGKAHHVDNYYQTEVAKAIIEYAENDYFERLWWRRHQLFKDEMIARQHPSLEKAEEEAAKIEKRLGKDTLLAQDLGEVRGKLSALRWVLGDKWDNLDT